MPFECHIDHARRVVITRLVGRVTVQDMFDYQRTVWSRPELAGLDEVVDTSGVEDLEAPNAATMRQLATQSVILENVVSRGRLAIVAPQQRIFGLGRMYEAYRGLEIEGKQEVAVFRTLADAAAYLGIALSVLENPAPPPGPVA